MHKTTRGRIVLICAFLTVLFIVFVVLKSKAHRGKLNQPTPPLERSRVVVLYRAQSCRQAANVVFFALGFLQIHHVHDGVEHLVQERVLH